jgi:phospholipase A1/A2
MAQPFSQQRSIAFVFLIALLGVGTPAQAQSRIEWQQCTRLTDDAEARLACFDRWAAQPSANAALASSQPVADVSPATTAVPAAVVPVNVILKMESADAQDCQHPRYSNLSRFWELEAGSDCGTFRIRGYRPISLSVIASDGANLQPASPSPDHTASVATPYSPTENRIQLSVRTKIAQGLLTAGRPDVRDSLWFGYSQQSNWQLFTPALSRPFRTTDHEPEITYILPTDAQLPGGWQLRYSGLSLVHQSNGQALPLSRSWNRIVVMAGMETANWRVTGRLWQRVAEAAADDDNPEIAKTIGRAELSGFWDVNPFNSLGITVRHSLTRTANGSVRLEWLKSFGDDPKNRQSGLRLHTQLFSGYGDSLVDYNRRRTVLSVGLSLVDW